MKTKGNCRGYITVFLSLTLTLLLSLVLTVIEGSRISAIRMKFECVADIGMNSILAEYHRELLEQYDLLFVDTSYGNFPSIGNTEAHLRNYIQKNLEGKAGYSFGKSRDFLNMQVEAADIIEYSIASDEEGNVLKRQVTDYMADYPIGALLEKLTGHKAQLDGLGLDTRDLAGERQNREAEIEEIGLPMREVEEGVFEEVPLNNPADIANATRSIGVLNLVISDISSVSTVRISPDEYISHRSLMKGNGICEEAVRVGGAPNDLLYLAYLLEKCGYYGNQKENSLLQYQIEYIIEGQDTDWKNLEQVARRLLRWREVANFIYLLSDGGKMAEAEAMALALTAVTLNPALAEPVKYTILFAWSYVESLQDVKNLLGGGKVPLMKTAGDWKTGIDSIKNVKGSLSDTGGSGNGLSYREYLEIMLFMTNDHDRTFRSMDLMEMDIRKTPGNSRFRMDGCFDTYRARLAVSSGFGYRYELERLYGFY